MGINDLKPILRTECPDVFHTTEIRDLAGARIAIDISVFLYRTIKSIGRPNWINEIINIICTLKKYKIKVVCIFDGAEQPEEKKTEQQIRRKNFGNMNERMKNLEEIRKELRTQYLLKNKSIPRSRKDELRKITGRWRIQPHKDGVDYTNASTVIEAINEKLGKMEKQTEPVTKEDGGLVREFLDTMGIAHMTSEGEAETLCCWLAIHGKVDFVLSEDTDILVYGAPFMCDFNVRNETVTIIKYKEVLEGIGLSRSCFIDFCIFSRCDYNRHEKSVYNPVAIKDAGIRKGNVGPKTALKIIRHYGTFEEIENCTQMDLSPLKWERCRDLFSVPTTIKKYKVPYDGEVKTERVLAFLKRVGSPYDLRYIEGLWKPTELIFDD